MVLLPHFECVLSYLLEEQHLAFISSCKEILFLIPGVSCNSPSFRKSSYFLQRFKGILLNPKESNRASPTQAYEMTICWAYGESIGILESQWAFCECLIFEAIYKKQLIMRLSEYSTLHILDFTINLGSEGEKYISLICPLFSLSWKIFKVIAYSPRKLYILTSCACDAWVE